MNAAFPFSKQVQKLLWLCRCLRHARRRDYTHEIEKLQLNIAFYPIDNLLPILKVMTFQRIVIKIESYMKVNKAYGGKAMEVNISELRKEGRPLWMTYLGEESFAGLLGGGGDIYLDRLSPDWDRFEGVEE